MARALFALSSLSRSSSMSAWVASIRAWRSSNWLATKAGGKVSTRQQAIQLTRGYILDGQGRRVLQVNGRCKHLLDEITSGYRNKEGPDGFEDKPEDGNDHACNALESWCWLRARR